MNQARRHRRRFNARRGVALSLELVMALPVLILILVASIEFTLMLNAGQGLSAAADMGTREAALPSATKLSVEEAVARAVQGYVWRNKVQTLVFVNDVKDAGQTDGTELASARTGDMVQVTVKVLARQTAPDALSIVKISLGTKELSSTFVTRRE